MEMIIAGEDTKPVVEFRLKKDEDGSINLYANDRLLIWFEEQEGKIKTYRCVGADSDLFYTDEDENQMVVIAA